MTHQDPLEDYVKNSVKEVFTEAIGTLRVKPQPSDALIYYMRLLKSSDLFKQACMNASEKTGLVYGEYPTLEDAKQAVSKHLLKQLMADFFIPDTDVNRDYFYSCYYGYNQQQTRIYPMLDVTPVAPDSITLSLPGVVIVVDEEVSRPQWTKLWEVYSEEIKKLKKVRKITKKMTDAADEKLTIYRLREEGMKNKDIAIKLQEMRGARVPIAEVQITQFYNDFKKLIDKL